MTNEVQQPIINSPYEVAGAHWKIHEYSLLKNTRASQLFAITGLPDIKLKELDDRGDKLLVVKNIQ